MRKEVLSRNNTFIFKYQYNMFLKIIPKLICFIKIVVNECDFKFLRWQKIKLAFFLVYFLNKVIF